MWNKNFPILGEHTNMNVWESPYFMILTSTSWEISQSIRNPQRSAFLEVLILAFEPMVQTRSRVEGTTYSVVVSSDVQAISFLQWSTNCNWQFPGHIP